MLCFARIDGKIFGARILADDHTDVDFFLRTNKKSAARLDIIQRIRGTYAWLHRNHHPAFPTFELAFESSVFLKQMTHHSFTTSQVDQVIFEPNKTSGGYDRFN